MESSDQVETSGGESSAQAVESSGVGELRRWRAKEMECSDGGELRHWRAQLRARA